MSKENIHFLPSKLTPKSRGSAPESRNEIVAGGSNVAGVGEVALIQIVAPRTVPSEALRAHPALVVRRLLYVVALDIFEAGSRHFLADIGHTIYSVASVSLHTTTKYTRLCWRTSKKRFVEYFVSFIPEDRAHTCRRVGYYPGSRRRPRSKALLRTHPTHRIDRHPVEAASNENSVSLHVSTL